MPKSGIPIKLTDGRIGRIIASDVKGPWPILALIEDGSRGEYGMPFNSDGGQGNTAARIENFHEVKLKEKS